MLATPPISYRATIPDDWLNIVGHVGMAFYLMLFDASSLAFFESIGVDAAYRQKGNTFFAAETHIVYEQELHRGDTVIIATTIIAADEKRIHLAQEMYREGETARICLQEVVFLSIEIASRRVAPWWPEAVAHIARTLAAHSTLPRPAKLGRAVGIRK
jgi:acyl-CoA thioester hydrolase